MSAARRRSEPPPLPPQRQTNGVSSTTGPSEIQSLLQVVYSHQRGHEDGTHDPTASVPRCRTMLHKVKRVLPKMLRLISSAHTNVAVEMLGDMCELLELLIHARVCPHAATAVFVDEPRTTADQASALSSTQSFATTATVLLYLVSFYCNERLLGAQPKVLDVMVQLAVLLQTREAPASLHFFRDSVELLEDCLLLEECLKRSEVESTEATATVASVACYLNTAIHAFNGADGPLGSGSSATLCGCVPVDDLSAAHARKQQLKALLPPIHVPSYGAAITLRKSIERLIADLLRVIGPQVVLDQSQQRLCLVVESLIGRDIELVSKMSRGSIVGGASASDTKAVVNATCELILALLCANCDFERSFLQVARVFFQGASGYAQIEESASGVAQILHQVAVNLPSLSLLGQEELWACIIHWHRERIEWVAQFSADALPLSWQTLLAPSLRLYGCMPDELLCISLWASVDLLQVVAGEPVDRDVKTNVVKTIHAYFSVQTRLIMFVQVCSRALTMRQQQLGQEGVMQKAKRRRTSHSLQDSRVPSTRDDLHCCEEISSYVLDLVFGRKRDGEDDVESLVLALQVLLPLRPLTDRIARVESQTITRIVIQRVEEVVISCERSESVFLSAAAVDLTTLLLTYLHDNEVGRFRLFAEGVILSAERNVPVVAQERERSIESLSTAQIFAMIADYYSLRDIPPNWTPLVVRNWLNRCDNFLQPLAAMDPVLRRQFLVLLVWRHHRAFNLRVERWIETKPGQVIKRICGEPQHAGDLQAAFISIMPMLLVFMDQDVNSSAIRDQSLRGLIGLSASSCKEGNPVSSVIQAVRAAVCIHSTLGAAHEGYREWSLPSNQSCCRVSEAASQSVVPPEVLQTVSAWFETRRSDLDVSAQLQLLALAATLLRHAIQRKADDGARAWAKFIFSALTDEDRVVRRVAIRSLRWCVDCPLFMELLLDPDEGPRSAPSVMEQLNNAIAQAMKVRDFLLLESCIEAIGTMCWSKKVTEGDRSDILVWGVVQLLVVWTNAHGKQSTVSTAVYDQMWRLFTRHGLSWKQLFVEYPEDLYYPVMDTLLRTRCLKHFARTFFGDHFDETVLLRQSSPFVLSQYVVLRQAEMMQMFAEGCIGDMGDGDVEMDGETSNSTSVLTDLLLDNMEYVLKELIIHQVEVDDPANRTKEWEFLFRYLPDNFTIRDAISSRQLHLLKVLARELGGDRAVLARKAFREISQYLIQGSEANEADANAGLMMPRQYFMALMADFGSRIGSKKPASSLAYRLRAIRSMYRLFKIIDHEGDDGGVDSVAGAIDPYVPKVMAILKVGLSDMQLRTAAIQAWGAFIRLLTPKALESNFVSIVVSVLPCIPGGVHAFQAEHARDGDSWCLESMMDEGMSGSGTATVAIDMASNASASAAIGVLRYLFVERRAELKQSFPRVRLIPSIPALDEVYASYVGEVGDPSKMSLVDFLTSCLPYMTHWDMGVREIVLRELHRALVTRSMELRQLLQSEGEYVDPSVLEILFAILHITRTDGSEVIRLLCAKCLGALGALDGARIPLNVLHSAGSLTASGKELAGKEKSGKEARVELTNKDLACVLIESWLVKELRAAPETADAIAYSIQELLLCLAEMTADPQHSGQHVSGVTNNSGRRARLQANAPMPDWMRRRFERKDVLQLVEPYWNTKYTFDIPRKSKPAETSPVFYEKYSSTYEEWLSAWCTRLIDLSQPPERSTFQACLTVISTSAAIARFLLPYLIQNVLRSGRPNVIAEVTQEMMAVLKDDGVMDDLANGVVIDAHPGLAVNDVVNDANERAFGEYSSRHHQCTQTIVSAIDELNEWLWSNDKKNLALSASASRSTSTPAPSELGDPEKENLEEFIKEIPSHVLSNAAFRIKAYARALQYFEVYLRQQKPTEKVDANNVNSLLAALPVDLALVAKHATYLQQLYSRVDEPDALTGLTTLRRLYDAQRPDTRAPDGGIADANSSLTDLLHQVVDHEQLAQWEDALACYEQAIQEINSAQAAHSFYSGEIPDRHEMHHDQIANLEVTRDPRKIKPALYSGIVQCLIQLGRLESALQHINGIVTQEPQFVGTLYPHALECAWRLSRWDLVSELLNTERQTSLLSNSLTQGGVSSRLRNLDVSQLSLVRVLHSLHEGNHVAFLKHLQEARLEIMGPLAAACAESYQRAYPLLHKLHFLHEAEQGFMSIRATSRMDPIAREKRWNEQCPWDARYDLLSASLKFRDPILALRRVMLQEADLRVEVSQNWLSYAKIARKEGYMRTATSAIMHAEALDNPYASLERAKLMVAQDRMYEALQILEPVDIDASRLDFKVDDPHYCAKNLLLATNWMQESGQRQGKKVVERYEAVIKFDPKWEKGYFFLAKYYEYLLSVSHPEAPTSMSATSSSRNDEASININATFHSHLINLMKNYVLALSHGTKHVFQAMPRLLTLWFEYGELLQPGSNKGSSVNKAMRSIEMELSQTSTEQQILSDITQIMQSATDNLPVYEWLVCFPQVTSRICHPNPVVVEGVKKIMMKVLLTYPKQAMWPLLGLSKSLNAQRRNRAREIITATQRQFVASNQQDISNSFAEGMRLAKELIEIAGDDQATQRKIKIHLSRVREHILVPVQAGLNTVLPSSGLAPSDDRHAAFMPHSQVFIKAFSDKADVMMTKEKPKRIEVLGTDGEFYPFLCKREKTGDLRKDARMMEFNTMINKLLQKDREGRKRKLRLRTYAVVCLNEESGLMEWVRNTKAMRQLIGQIHKAERGFIQPLRLTHEIKERFLGMQKKYADNVSVMGKYYRIKILTLPVFTPRFHQWFTNNFADPTAWFEARLAFSRSAAVWSMVGHIIGLGDRHGENILIDTKNGECVHVDFDCLFDKGLKLAKPEIVPFRLTPNIIDAFGITGYEGVFRRVCEVTMELLRDNKETLRSVLESFIHDPLVEWGRRGKTAQGMTGATATGRSIADIPSDRSKEETRVILKTIDDRLTGIYNLGDAIRPLVSSSHRNLLPENETLPLSVQGQVDKLIHEATAHENLAQMYIGWMPFL